MVEILLKFLAALASKVSDRAVSGEWARDRGLRVVFDFYNSLCRIHDHLCDFLECLQRYQDNGFNSDDLFRCSRPVRGILAAMRLLDSDATKAIRLLDFDLALDLRGFLTGKSDVMRLWLEVLEKNSEGFIDYDSGPVDGIWTKRIRIPDYSLLAVDVVAGSPRTDYAGLSEGSWFRWHFPPSERFLHNLEYLPDLRLDFTDGNTGRFSREHVRVINIPGGEAELAKITALTGYKVAEFREMVKRLGDVVLKFADGKPERLLKYISQPPAAGEADKPRA